MYRVWVIRRKNCMTINWIITLVLLRLHCKINIHYAKDNLQNSIFNYFFLIDTYLHNLLDILNKLLSQIPAADNKHLDLDMDIHGNHFLCQLWHCHNILLHIVHSSHQRYYVDICIVLTYSCNRRDININVKTYTWHIQMHDTNSTLPVSGSHISEWL